MRETTWTINLRLEVKEMVPLSPPIVRNDAAAVQSLFQQNVVPSYGRFDIVLSHGAGSYLYDITGKRFLDLGGGMPYAAPVGLESTGISVSVAALNAGGSRAGSGGAEVVGGVSGALGRGGSMRPKLGSGASPCARFADTMCASDWARLCRVRTVA